MYCSCSSNSWKMPKREFIYSNLQIYNVQLSKKNYTAGIFQRFLTTIVEELFCRLSLQKEISKKWFVTFIIQVNENITLVKSHYVTTSRVLSLEHPYQNRQCFKMILRDVLRHFNKVGRWCQKYINGWSSIDSFPLCNKPQIFFQTFGEIETIMSLEWSVTK